MNIRPVLCIHGLYLPGPVAPLYLLGLKMSPNVGSCPPGSQKHPVRVWARGIVGLNPLLREQKDKIEGGQKLDLSWGW